MSLRKMWASEAERLPVLENEQQTRAGVLVFDDMRRGLRFVWNGSYETPVSVTAHDHPGVRWEFEYNNHRHPRSIAAGTRSLVVFFMQTCERWADAKEDAR